MPPPTRRALLMALLLEMVQPFSPLVAHPTAVSSRSRLCHAARHHAPHTPLPRGGSPQMFGPGGGGGFLNLGTPEVIVIGAVAWALLGPKELYRLARQAGEFLGEWQQLGMQARDSFKEAIETEMRGDESKAKEGEAERPSPFAKFTPDAIRENVAPMGVPPLANYAEAKRKEQNLPDFDGEWMGDLGREVSAEEKADLYRKAVAEMGDPETNRKTFAEQISGERNAAVLEEYPRELSFEEWKADPLKPEEDLLRTQIEEAENRIAMLRAEAKVLALRRKQQQANAERAQKLEEEAALESLEKPARMESGNN